MAVEIGESHNYDTFKGDEDIVSIPVDLIYDFIEKRYGIKDIDSKKLYLELNESDLAALIVSHVANECNEENAELLNHLSRINKAIDNAIYEKYSYYLQNEGYTYYYDIDEYLIEKNKDLLVTKRTDTEIWLRLPYIYINNGGIWDYCQLENEQGKVFFRSCSAKELYDVNRNCFDEFGEPTRELTDFRFEYFVDSDDSVVMSAPDDFFSDVDDSTYFVTLDIHL